jgi:hypothetical protein
MRSNPSNPSNPILSSFLAALVFCVLCTLRLQAADGDGPPVVEHRKFHLEPDAIADEKLDRKLPEVNFKDNTLADVMDFLRDVTGTNIFVNWKALAAEKITKETPVTAQLKDVRFSKVLQVILDGAAGGDGKLAFRVDDGVIEVTTTAEIDKRVETRPYDVRFLLAAKDAADREKRVASVLKLITGSVDPTSWRDAGGRIGAIKEVAGQLVITQNKKNQKAIANLVDQTRELMEEKEKNSKLHPAPAGL